MGGDGFDEGKIFVGGLAQSTTKESLRKHFGQFGTISDCIVMVDSSTSRSRGFGFVTFENTECIDNLLASKQVVDGKEVDCKRACPRESISSSRGVGPAGQFRTDKIFVGGLPDLTTEEFKAYFEKFGTVLDAVLMQEKATGRPRGFGFITFDSTDPVEEAIRKYYDHSLKGKWVEVKRAHPKEQMVPRPRYGGGGGDWQPMGGAPEYDSYRQMQPHHYGAGFERRGGPGGYGQGGYDMYGGAQGYGYGQEAPPAGRQGRQAYSDPYSQRGGGAGGGAGGGVGVYSDPYQPGTSNSYPPSNGAYPPSMYSYDKSYGNSGYSSGYGVPPAAGGASYSNGSSSVPPAYGSASNSSPAADPYNAYSVYSQYGPQRGGSRNSTGTRTYPY